MVVGNVGKTAISRSGSESSLSAASWVSYFSVRPSGSFPEAFRSSMTLPALVIVEDVSFGIASESGKYTNDVSPRHWT